MIFIFINDVFMKNLLLNLLYFLKEAFSENGTPSSKRIVGGFMILVITICTGWSIMKFGMTDNNKSVVEIEIISGCSLLGLSSVTSIWKNNEINNKNNEEE